ncbi:MAG: response regulator transcription factor [Halioglobus sp.]|nr:response regulator transcription factor [Halioglobus sp.]
MKILVVDDEVLARERLLRLLHRLRPRDQCLEAGSGTQALAQVQQHAPELLLLDIRMPGMDGIEVAASLATMDQPPAVIFCTAYDQYALAALQQHAVAYLVKPVREADLSRALAQAARVNRLQLASLRQGAPDGVATAPGAARSQVSCQTHRGVEMLAVTDVRCFLAEQKYVAALSPTARLLLPDTLKELEREFDRLFVRVHRNALVALEHIVRLQREDGGAWRVVLDGVSERPLVSRRHLAQAKQRLLAR